MTYSVATAELPGSPVENWGDDGSFEATVQRVCAWSVRTILAGEIYGELYPRIPTTLARARTVSVQPYPDNSEIREAVGHAQHAEYDQAKLTVQYRSQGEQKDDAAGDWFNESIEPTTEFMTMPKEGFTWASGVALSSEDADPGVQIRGLEYKLTRYHLRIVPTAVLTLTGCVNNATIYCRRLGLVFPTETLLYHPPVVQDIAKSDGSYDITLSMRFTYRPDGWNKWWRKATGKWERMQKNGVDYYHYYLGDFSPLLS